MTLALFGFAALVAAAGTRGAALVFLVVAVLGVGASTLPALVTWTAALAAGLTLTPGSPRRLAVPALGAAAALGAGSARNTAVVLGLWVLGTGAAVLSRGKRPSLEADRWALTLCAADIPVVAAVAWTASDTGFEGWPLQLDAVAVALMLLAAMIRAPLVSGPDDDSQEPGLLTVRAQTVALLLVAMGAPAADGILSATAVLGAAGFLVGGVAARAATRDAIQEVALVALVVTAARAGWGPGGWEWGALAAGTLIHNLRLRLESGVAGPLAGALQLADGLGLPLLPVVLVGLEGATRIGGWIGSVMLLGLVGGLVARVSASRVIRRAPAEGLVRRAWEPGIATAILAACVVAGLWAPVLTMPDTVAGSAVGWPPIWAAGVVLVAAAGAGIGWGRVTPAEGPVASASHPWQPVSLSDLRVPARLAGPRVIVASTGLLGVLALAMWVAGVARGFL